MRFSGYAVISSVKQILAVLREGDGHFIQKCRWQKLEEKPKALPRKQFVPDDGTRGWGSHLQSCWWQTCRGGAEMHQSLCFLLWFFSLFIPAMLFFPCASYLCCFLDCLDLVQMAKSHTYFTVIFLLPWGSTKSRLFPLILPLGHHVLIGCKM